MATYTQDHRAIRIHTPLGKDELLLQSFTGEEGISKPFQFDLKLHSKNRSINFEAIMGRPAAIGIVLGDGTERYIHGLINSFSQVGASTRLAHYEATLVPWLWMLTRTSDCRIFQDKTVPDIIGQIFKEHKFADYRIRLKGHYEPHEYCVQYRETDFNFVSRLMEEQGIFYFFEHKRDKHTLVLADSPVEFKPCPAQTEARFDPSAALDWIEESVTGWGIKQEVRPGMYTIKDFNFKQPRLDLTMNVVGDDKRRYEIYDYFAGYEKVEQGERLVGIRMDEQDAAAVIARGSSRCRAFTSGYRFKLTDHYRADLNREYVLTAIQHSCDLGDDYETTDDASARLHYENQIQCIPHPKPFHPPRNTPQPFVRGSQTAIVVGPPGEEIYVDQYGRVKVQFHWDREGQYNHKSSCWIRVSQNWAGKRWGAIFIPRVGQEVIVDFLEGDPDAPIITGRVYNGEQTVPYKLPDEGTKSAIKSYSSKGGEGFNELRFEDKKGAEQIFIHAERNEDIRVKNDLIEWVGHDTHLIVKHDQIERIDEDQHLTIGGDKSDKVGGTVSLTAGADIQEKAGSKYALHAGSEIHLIAGMNLVLESGATITIKAGGGFITIGPGGVTIMGVMVKINSGGTPGSGAGASPELPKQPLEADKARPGKMSNLPPPPKATAYSTQAKTLKRAARRGSPFCEVCQ